MIQNLSKDDVAKLKRVFSVLVQWSGISDDSPADTEIISSDNGGVVNLEDLLEAIAILDSI